MIHLYNKMPSEGFFGAAFTTVDRALNWFRGSDSPRSGTFSSAWLAVASN
jgi:hypothetical protein